MADAVQRSIEASFALDDLQDILDAKVVPSRRPVLSGQRNTIAMATEVQTHIVVGRRSLVGQSALLDAGVPYFLAEASGMAVDDERSLLSCCGRLLPNTLLVGDAIVEAFFFCVHLER